LPATMAPMLGIRNSTDKSMPVGIAGGTKVFICDNMALSGDMVMIRRHTSGLTVESFYLMLKEALDTAIPKITQYAGWHEGLKEQPLTDQEFRNLTFDAMQRRVINPSQFVSFTDAYYQENEENRDCGETLYAFFGAVTREMRGENLFTVATRTAKAEALVNDFTLRREGQVPLTSYMEPIVIDAEFRYKED